MQDSDSRGLKVCSLDALLVLVDGLLVRLRFWGRELKLLDGPRLRFGRRELDALLVLVDGLLVRRRFWGRELKLLDGPGLRFGRREPQLLLEGLRLRLGRLRLRFGL